MRRVVLTALAFAGLLVLATGVGFAGEATPAEDHMSLDFEDQTVDDREVVVENADSGGDFEASIIVGHHDGDDVVIAGIALAGNVAGEDVPVELVSTDGLPGEYTALILPFSELSTDRYSVGDTLSDDTFDAAVDQETATVSGDPPTSTVTDLDIAGQGERATITEGDDEDITANVTNVGEETQSFDVELRFSFSQYDSISTDSLAPGESEIVTFAEATGHLDSDGAPPAVDVLSDDNGIGGSLLIEETAGESDLSNLDIAGQGTDATIDIGDDEDISVLVENVGDETASFSVDLTIYEDIAAGDIAHEETIETDSLSPDADQTITFESVTGTLGEGDHQVQTTTTDASRGGILTVQSDAESTLSELDVAGQGADGTIDQGVDEPISVNVTNVGTDPGTFNVDLTLDGTVETESTGQLAGGEETTVTFTGVTDDLDEGVHELSVSSEDDSLGGSVTVEPDDDSSLSELDIDGQGVSATITEGEDVDVTANVTNVGEETQSFDVDLGIGAAVDRTESTGDIAPGESTTVTFADATGDLDATNYSVTVSTPDDEVTGTLVVEAPAESVLSDLDIAAQGTDATIEAGTNADVTVNVTNVGETDGSFEVDLDIGTDIQETESTGSLRTDETQTVVFEDVTGDLDPDAYTVTVETADDSIQGDLTVGEVQSSISDLAIAGQGIEATITEGDDEDVTVAVTNEGEETQSFDVDLTIGGVDESESTGDIAPGTTETVTFTAVTGDLDPDNYTVTVETSGDSVTGDLMVSPDEPSALSDLDIAGQGTDGTVVEGDAEDISVLVENDGTSDMPVSYDVTLEIGDAVTQTETVTGLRGGQQDTVTFTDVTGELDAAATAYDVDVSTEHDIIAGTLTVEEPAESSLSGLDVAGQGADGTIVEGAIEDISVNVTNDGEAAGSFEVELTLDGETYSASTDPLSGGETETVTFEAVTGDLEAAGTAYDVDVSTEDDDIAGTLTVEEPAESALSGLDVAGEGADGTIVEGENEDISVNVTNDAEAAGSFEVELTLDGETYSASTDPLSGGETETVTFEAVTGDLEAAGTAYDVDASTEDDDIAGTLTVEEPAGPPESSLSVLDVAGDGTDATIVEGDAEDIAVNVTNVGDEVGSFDVSLTIAGEVDRTESTGDIASSETEVVVFEDATEPLPATDAPYGITLETDDDDISGTVTVLEPAEGLLSALDVAGQGEDATILEGDAQDVTVNVTNDGGVAGEFTVDLDIGTGVDRSTETDTLDPGDTTTVTFTDVTGDLTPDSYDVDVSTAADDLTGSLTVDMAATGSLDDLDVAGQDTEATILVGDAEDIAVDLTNVGDRDGAFTVDLTVGDIEESVTTDTIEPGTTETVTFEDVTGAVERGSHTVTISTAGDEETGSLTVEAPAAGTLTDLDIAGQGAEATVIVDEANDLHVTVTNAGDIADSFTVDLAVGDEIDDTVTTDELAGGENQTVTFGNVTGDLDLGDYPVTVSTADATVTGNLSIVELIDSLTFAEQNVGEDGGILLEDVTGVETPVTVLVTYESAGERIVAGHSTGEYVEEDVSVTLAENDGFPEEYEAHLVHADDTSTEYEPGETLSEETLDTQVANDTAMVRTTIGAPMITVVGDDHAKDTTGDGLLNNIRGDGEFDIFDVQTLFGNLDSPAIQENAEYFNFQQSDEPEVNIFDVQALFAQL